MIPHLLCCFFRRGPNPVPFAMYKNSDAHRDLSNLEHAWETSSANFENPKCLALVASHGGVSAVVAGRSGCLGGCTILPYCSRTFWAYIAPLAFLSKRVVCSLALLIAIFFKSGEGTCASNPSKRFKESVKKKPAVWNVGFSCFGGLGNLDSWRVQLKKVKFVARFRELILDPFWSPILGTNFGAQMEPCEEKRGGGAKAEP